jgi:IS30 family transposase
MKSAIAALPDELVRTLTWDQSNELSSHIEFSVDRRRRVLLRPATAPH